MLQHKIYLPTSVLRNPSLFLLGALSDVRLSLSIGYAIFIRDFTAKYRQTWTGYLGMFVPLAVTTASFAFLQKANIINYKPTIEYNYASFVFVNTIFWELFIESVSGPTRELQSNISSITRLNYPRESIFVASILNIGFNFLIKCVALIGLIVLFGIPVTWNMLFLILVTLGLLSFGFLIGLVTLPISMLYSDFRTLIDLGFRLLFFITPVAYEINAKSIGVEWIHKFNILTPFFITIKEIIFMGTFPTHLGIILFLTVVSSLLLIVGWIFYRISLPILVERMPA